MITWLQVTFQKHMRWLFLILLAIIIVTFVLTIGPQSVFTSRSAPRQQEVEFFGQNLASPELQRSLSEDAQLSAMLHPEKRISANILQSYALNRLAALSLANQVGIPKPGEDEMRAYIQERPLFFNAEGTFDSNGYNSMISQLTSTARFSRSQIARIFLEDARISKLVDLLGGPGFVHPFQVDEVYRQTNTSYDLKVATLQMIGFTPEINPSDEELRTFYEANVEHFRIPDMIVAEVLDFKAEDYLTFVETPDEAVLRDYFRLNQFRYDTPAAPPAEDETNGETPEPEPVTYEEVSDLVLQDWKREEAIELARTIADEFSLQLWNQEIEYNSPRYQELIAQDQVTVTPLPPYADNNPPRHDTLQPRQIQGVFEPNYTGRYFSDLIQTREGAALLVYKGTQPTIVPEFENVRERVASLYTVQERQRLLMERGEELREGLQTALQSGQTFEDAAASLELGVSDLEPFSVQEPPDSITPEKLNAIRDLDVGEVSRMIAQTVVSQFYYMESKETADPSENADAVAELANSLSESRAQGDGWGMIRQLTDARLQALNVSP